MKKVQNIEAEKETLRLNVIQKLKACHNTYYILLTGQPYL
jgi:hypothetical protein